MLRASATVADRPTDLAAIQEPTTQGGVDAAPELAALVDAIVEGGPEAVGGARADVVELLGPDAAVDATAIVANFEMMTRVADATGTLHETVDPDVAQATGADGFASAP